MRVLFVDDDSITNDLAKILFKNYNIDVVACYCKEATGIVEREEFDLIILSCDNVDEIAGKMKNFNPNAIIIAYMVEPETIQYPFVFDKIIHKKMDYLIKELERFMK